MGGRRFVAERPRRLEAALDDLRALAELGQELSQLLFWRALKQVASS